MAKKGRRGRKFRRYIKGGVDESLTLTTLASKTLVSADFDEQVEERTFASSIQATYSITQWTEATGVGPVLVGIAHSDYSDPELEEWIEQVDSWDEGDLIGQEVAKRRIRKIGVFQSPPQSSPFDTSVLNNGKPIKTKLKWVLRTGQTLNLWAYNLGTAAFATTAPVIDLQGHVNLWPL